MGLLSGLLGGDTQRPESTEEATFQPYSLTTSSGTTTGTQGEGGAFNYDVSLDPALSGLQGNLLQGAQGSLDNYRGALQQAPSQFNPETNYNFQSQNQGAFGGIQGANFQAPQFNAQQATQQYFDQGLQSLNPQFQQMNTNLAQSLQGSGRTGLSVADGQGGFQNPDISGVAQAQSQALTDLYGRSRQSALGEQQQMFGQALGTEQQRLGAGQAFFGQDLGMAGQNLAGQGQQFGQQLGAFGANADLRQQYLNNQMGGFNNMFSGYGNISGLESNLLNQGISGEQARSGAYQGSMFMPTQTEGLFSSALGGLASGYGMGLGRGGASLFGGGANPGFQSDADYLGAPSPYPQY